MAPWLLDLAAASLGIVAYLYFAWVLHFRLDLLNRQWARVRFRLEQWPANVWTSRSFGPTAGPDHPNLDRRFESVAPVVHQRQSRANFPRLRTSIRRAVQEGALTLGRHHLIRLHRSEECRVHRSRHGAERLPRDSAAVRPVRRAS